MGDMSHPLQLFMVGCPHLDPDVSTEEKSALTKGFIKWFSGAQNCRGFNLQNTYQKSDGNPMGVMQKKTT
jgi:hypothetical protein